MERERTEMGRDSVGLGKRVLRRVCEGKERGVRVTEVEGGPALPRIMEGGQNARVRDL